VVVVIAIEAFLYIYLKDIIYPQKKLISIDPKSLLIDYINVEIKNEDGQKLVGWLMLNKASNGKVVLMLPGYNSNKAELINAASKIYNLGYSLLLVDLRGQGESEGNKSTLGVLEKEDINYILTYIMNDNRLQANSIAIWGDNMSAYASLFAVEKFPQVKLLLLNDVYPNPVFYLKNKLTLPIKIPDYLVEYVLYKNLRYLFDIDAKKYDARNILPVLKGRVLVFIKTDEREYEYVKQLYDISPERKELLILKHVGVEALNASDWEGYYELMKEKISTYLPLNEANSVIHLNNK
jgi:pimeloyl-ACP methyl ester carboxylesterase